MLLFIYNLTRIFYEKLLSLCQNQGAKWQKREVAISHNCKAQLIPLFYPQLRNYLIIRGVYFLHRNGERADAWENDPEGSWCKIDDTQPQGIPCGACGSWVLLDILGEQTDKPTKIYALDDTLEFGKHKGKTLREVIKEDWSWVEWAIDQSEHFFCDIDDVMKEREATIKVLSADDVLTFGKYKGKTLREIHSENPNYLIWVSQNTNDFVIDFNSLND